MTSKQEVKLQQSYIKSWYY